MWNTSHGWKTIEQIGCHAIWWTRSDWRLKRNVFLELENQLSHFSIDLFAFMMNGQLEVYCSWKPNPRAVAVDALSIACPLPHHS